MSEARKSKMAYSEMYKIFQGISIAPIGFLSPVTNAEDICYDISNFLFSLRPTSHSVFLVTGLPTTVSAWARAALDTSTRTTEATTTKPRREVLTTLQVGRATSTVTTS